MHAIKKIIITASILNMTYKIESCDEEELLLFGFVLIEFELVGLNEGYLYK